MEITGVRAICDCPHSVDSVEIFANDDDSIFNQMDYIEEGIEEHLSESEHCSEENVERKIYAEGDWG